MFWLSVGTLIVSGSIWEFINFEAYTAQAYGPEFCLIESDAGQMLILGAAVLTSILAIFFAWKARRGMKQKYFASALILVSALVPLLGFLQIAHTFRTVDYAVLQEHR